MKLRLTTTNDLTAVMTIINQAKVYFKEQGINQWQDGYPDELTKPSIRMDTHDDNLSMQRFLIKYGFEYCGTIYL